MSRLDYVTIAIVAVCVAALVYLIYMTTSVMGNDNSSTTQTEEPSTLDEDTEDDGYYYDESADSSVSAEDEGYYDDYTSDEELDKGRTSYDDETSSDNYNEERAEPATTNNNTITSSYGDYLVIAGTFKVKSNAEDMVSRLRQKGYTDARVEIFDRGAYAVALVGQFDDYSEAQSLKKRLSGDDVEAFVKRKQ